MAKLNGSTKWISLAILIIGSIITLTLSFANKASNCDLEAVEAQVQTNEVDIKACTVEMANQKEVLQKIETTVDKIYDKLLEGGQR